MLSSWVIQTIVSQRPSLWQGSVASISIWLSGSPKSSGHFLLGNVVLEPCNGLSPFNVSQLSLWWHDQNKSACSQMSPYKATNVTTFHTQGQLLHVHHVVFTWLGYCVRATRSNWGFFDILHLFVITQHTVREFFGSGNLTRQHTHARTHAHTHTHCLIRIHSHFVSVEKKTEFIHTWNDNPFFSYWSLTLCVVYNVRMKKENYT